MGHFWHGDGRTNDHPGDPRASLLLTSLRRQAFEMENKKTTTQKIKRQKHGETERQKHGKTKKRKDKKRKDKKTEVHKDRNTKKSRIDQKYQIAFFRKNLYQ